MFIVPLSSLPQMGSSAAVKDSVGRGDSMNQGKEAFLDIFENALDEVRRTDAIAKQDSLALAAGQVEDVAQVLLNSLQATTTLEVATQLTGRAVGAYKEIMQMQL